MNYIKKLCILKQVASGFAADGREVSALLTAESLGGRLTLTLAPIGFAPLAAGRYRCVVADADGRREAFDLPVPAGAAVRRASGLDIARGLGCAVCFVSGKATPVAFGKVGEGQYDPRAMCAEEGDAAPAPRAAHTDAQGSPPDGPKGSNTEKGTPPADPPYDDEMLATENYFEREKDDEATERMRAPSRNRCIAGNSKPLERKKGRDGTLCVAHKFFINTRGERPC